MQILLKSQRPQAVDLRERALRRVRFVFRRFAERIPQATVQLSDINGPRGGIDKRCQVELKTHHLGTVVISDVAADWRTALDRALARAARFLARLIDRSASSRRRPRLAHDRPGDA